MAESGQPIKIGNSFAIEEIKQALEDGKNNVFDSLMNRLQSMDEEIDSLGVNVRSLGVVGDGTTDDLHTIESAINNYSNLYFPEGKYALGDLLHLSGVHNKTLRFHPKSKLVRTGGMTQWAVIAFSNCTNFDIYNLTATSEENLASNVIWMSTCSNFNFRGITKVEFSKSWTFSIRERSHDVIIETLIVNQPDDAPATKDGLGIINSYNITVGTVIGIGDNSDDLVVLKTYPNKGPIYNINIDRIISLNGYAGFSIGSEIGDDIHDVNVGLVHTVETKYGLYFKQYVHNTGDWVGHPLEDYGEIYNINIDRFISTTYKRMVGDRQILFMPSTSTEEFRHNFHDIYIGHVDITGACLFDFTWIENVKNMTIGYFKTTHKQMEEDTRQINRRGLYVRQRTDNFQVLNGGIVESLETPIELINYNERCYINNLTPRSMNIDGTLREDKDLIKYQNSTLRITNCDLTAPAVNKINQVRNFGANIPFCSFKNNLGRDIGVTEPNTDTALRGEVIFNPRPDLTNFVGWICTNGTAPSIWKRFGTIES